MGDAGLGVEVVEEVRVARRSWRGAEGAGESEREEEYLILMREERKRAAGLASTAHPLAPAAGRARGRDFEVDGWQGTTLGRPAAGDAGAAAGDKRRWASGQECAPSVSLSGPPPRHGGQQAPGPAPKRARQRAGPGSGRRPEHPRDDPARRQLERYFDERLGSTLRGAARAGAMPASSSAPAPPPGGGGGLHGFLRRREVGVHHSLGRRLRGNQVRNCRKMYECIVPDTTHDGVENCPAAHLRRFTDDGKLLLGFSVVGNSFVAYRYRGGGAAAAAGTPVSGQGEPRRQAQRDAGGSAPVSFGDFFEPAINVKVCAEPEILCKDFCISLMDGQMVLLVSYALPGEAAARGGAPAADEPPCVPGLPSYGRLRFHILRLGDGAVTDTFTLYNSFVNLAHNGGVHVLRDMVLILNLRVQRIQILHLRPGGTFVEGMCIGPHCFEDDDLVLRTHHEEEARARALLGAGRAQCAGGGEGGGAAAEAPAGDAPGAGERPPAGHRAQDAREKPQDNLLSGLKQRLMAYILRDAQARDRMNDRKDAVRTFYSNFDFLSKLYFTRAQFLNRHHILLRLSGIEGIASRTSDAAQQNAYFVVYDFVRAEVKGFFRNTDEDFLKIVEQNIAQLSLPAGAPPWVQLAAVCDGLRKRCSPDGAASSINTIKRALYSLPPSPMSYCCSPYLDPSIFQYDEKMISTADRPRPCAEHPVKFLLKSRPGILSFKLSPSFGTLGGSDGRGKKLAAYIFHPVLPFVLSIVHGSSMSQRSHVVSFHVR